MRNVIRKFSLFLLGGLTFTILIVSAYSFVPVGKVNGDIIYNYQLQERYKTLKSNAIKNIAKDRVFFNAMAELGITASEEEINEELKGYYERYGGKEELENVLIFTLGDIETLKLSIKRGNMAKKAVEYFAQQEEGDGNEKEQKANNKYTELINKLEEKTSVVIY